MFKFSDKKFDVISAGEVIMRLSPISGKILSQRGSLDRTVGGAELNVLTGISSLGGKTSLITKLPDHDLGLYAKKSINTNGVDGSFIVKDLSSKKRLALYYYEYGAFPRKPSVVYDRNDSSFQYLSSEEIDSSVYSMANIFHISGITLGLCENSKKLTFDLIEKFKEKGTVISFDVNYRKNLWGNEDNAQKEISKILPHIDILFASEETLIKMFKQSGTIEEMMKNFAKENKISLLVSTQRVVNSPKSHDFSSTIYSLEEDKFYSEAPYKNIEIVDRIGSGDAYVAGALYGISKYNDPEKALKYGNAIGAMKNTLVGDVAIFSKATIDNTIKDHEEGSTSEMNR